LFRRFSRLRGPPANRRKGVDLECGWRCWANPFPKKCDETAPISRKKGLIFYAVGSITQ
jgi:hypothetical protein